MAVTHTAGAYYIGAAATTYGEIQSFTENNSAEIDEALDASGDVFAIGERNEKAEVTMEVVTTGALPAAGTTVAVVTATGAGSVVISSVNITESNTDFRKATITGTRYLANTLPA